MADTYTPDIGQHIDAAGRVTYDFDGHVRAKGLDFDTVWPKPAGDDYKIRWINQADGSLVAIIEGWGQANNRTLSIGAGDNTRVFIEERPGQPAQFQQIWLSVPGGSGLNTLTVLNGDDDSDLLRLASTQKLLAEIDSVTVTGVPVGNSSASVGVPWTNTHTGAAILSVIPSVAYGFTIMPRVSAVNQIEFVITGNPNLQDIALNWITFGT